MFHQGCELLVISKLNFCLSNWNLFIHIHIIKKWRKLVEILPQTFWSLNLYYNSTPMHFSFIFTFFFGWNLSVSSLRNVDILGNLSLLMFSFDFRLLGYEGVEVINPEGGKEDAEEEAQRGRWKPEVLILLVYFVNVIFFVPTFFRITLFFYFLLRLWKCSWLSFLCLL